MNKKSDKKKLPKFKTATLGPDELSQVTGGMAPNQGCTTSTRSVCHIDGVDDAD